MLLDLIARNRPGVFIDARLQAEPTNAIIYRTRQPIIAQTLKEIPLIQDLGVFRVSAIMSDRIQVAICVRFNDNVTARVVQGDHATFLSNRVKGNVGQARTALKTNDYLIFDYESRGALLVKKLAKGRGYGSN